MVGLVFGLMHLNQVSTLTGAITLLLAAQLVSFLFAAIYERTGSIWCGALVHTLWDMFTGSAGFRFVKSFETASKWIYQVAGMDVNVSSRLLSGGDFGVDASLPAMVLYAVAGGLLLWKRSAPVAAAGVSR